jgi:hypothetical protein
MFDEITKQEPAPGIGHNGGPSLADDTMETAGELSLFLFGVNDYAHRRKVYRWAAEKNPEDRLPVTRRGSILRGRKSVITCWIAERERRAAGETATD